MASGAWQGPSRKTRGEAERRAAHQLRALRRSASGEGRVASRRSTAALATGPSGRWWLNSGPGFLGRGIGANPSPASSSQTGRNAGRPGPRSRPSARLRSTPAGTASRSIRRTPPDGAPQRAGLGRYTQGFMPCQGIMFLIVGGEANWHSPLMVRSAALAARLEPCRPDLPPDFRTKDYLRDCPPNRRSGCASRGLLTSR